MVFGCFRPKVDATEVHALQGSIAVLEATNSEVLAELSDCRNELAASKQEVNSTKAELQAMKLQYELQLQVNKKALAAVEEQEAKVKELQAELQAAKASSSNLQQGEGKLKQQLVDTQSEVAQKERQLSEAQEQVKKTEQQLVAVQEQLQKSEEQLQAKARQLAETSTELQEKGWQVNDLQQAIGGKDQRLQEQEAKVAEMTARISDLQAQLGDRDAKLQDAAAFRAKALSKFESLQKQLEKVKKDRQHLKEQVERRDKALKMANAVIDALSNPEMLLGDDEEGMGPGMTGWANPAFQRDDALQRDDSAGIAAHTTMQLLPQASPAVRASSGNNRYSGSNGSAKAAEQQGVLAPAASTSPVRDAAVEAWPAPAPTSPAASGSEGAMGAVSSGPAVRDSLAAQRASRAAALRNSLRASIHATKTLIAEAWAEPVSVAPDTPLPTGFASTPEGEEGEEGEGAGDAYNPASLGASSFYTAASSLSPAPTSVGANARTPSRKTPMSQSAAWAGREGASLGSLAKAAAAVALTRASTGTTPNKLLAAMNKAGADTHQAIDNVRV